MSMTNEAKRNLTASVSNQLVRNLGYAMVALGAFLTLTFGSLIVGFIQVLRGDLGNVFFEGTKFQATAIFGLFFFLLAFGLISAYGGLRQIQTGQRDPRVASFGAFVFVVISILGTLAAAVNEL